MTDVPNNIEEVRNEIDRIDRELVDLINRRAECAIEVGRLKESKTASIFAPEREMQVISKVLGQNKGPLADKTISAIYREVISACRALEKPITVCYFGPAGSNTHIASIRRFGESGIGTKLAQIFGSSG